MGPSRRSQANCQGFGLLEVMVATALMGLVLVVLLQVLTGAMRAQETTLRHAQALQVANQLLQKYCNTSDLGANQYEGEAGRYTYQVLVTPQYQVTLPSVLDRMVRCSLIQVKVSWQERGRSRSISLETVRAATQRK